MKAVSVLIKPVSGSCNIKCEYCFYLDEASYRDTPNFGRMSLETLEAIVSKVFACAEQSASFAFQGGEPTLRGLDFYRTFVELQKKYNIRNISVTNCLQTNGLVIDDAWADFLHKNDFLVGLSLDGPKEIHDRFRRYHGGRGTYSDVMKTARILRKHDVTFNILFTVTSESAKEPGKLYSFFRKNGFDYLQFMPCIDPYYGTRGSDPFSLRPQEFLFFLTRFFDRWSAEVLSGASVSVRYFDNLCCVAAGLPAEACSMRGTCSCQFIFEADGSCYPCDFYVTEQWKAGNIHDSSLEELFASHRCQEFLSTGNRLSPDCQNCKWLRVCRGGCRRDREDLDYKNYYCRAYGSFLDAEWPKIRQVSAYLLSRSRQAVQ